VLPSTRIIRAAGVVTLSLGLDQAKGVGVELEKESGRKRGRMREITS